MKKPNIAQPNPKETPPLKKEVFDTFLKKAIESPKVQTRKKVKKKA